MAFDGDPPAKHGDPSVHRDDPGVERGGTSVERGGAPEEGGGPHVADRRSRKYRQAAFVYLHVGILYEAAVWTFAQVGALPAGRGPAWLWLGVGALILGVVVWGLWSWQNAWFARAVWALHALRLPGLMEGAFFPEPGAAVPSSFYLTAIFVVLVNLGFLARAAWDL